ncbi:alkaline phosphatase PafA [Pseudotamlana carrageenivorans]|uniref:glycerophosphocholine cholinephosphodiesterase n=1 Tax=Pseudotamlana carrageenivorans TaxID=2069432 RepID=A0A2I7SFM3_9FLAO|nr:alkaline phosphatase PafA [Tamlana carrageenivorans]AUS04695.1 alkaline phosphatase [Tamlana carrageenivorans]
MKKVHLFVFTLAILCSFVEIHSQSTSSTKKDQTAPKLVVGIVVDQMRYDYLTRFYSRYGTGGFKRMMDEGFNCKNNHFNYVPTKTAPGHASIFTGSTPKYHGIISNYWYDKETKEQVYCADDDSVLPIGTSDKAGKMSPSRMLTTTFADENKLFTQMRGKTIGISVKDRGAILPAGHTADAAYWFHGDDEGAWITSSFYMDALPKWVAKFNASKQAASYFKKWDTYYDIDTYTASGADLNDYEAGFKGKETATFPYNLKALKDKNGNFSILKITPFGNSLTTDFAIAAIKGESLGADDITDVLTVSYSCTDYIGHNFGVNSKEIEDTYIRLDQDLERFFNVLDKEVGKGEYVVFLTADHGAVDVPAYLHAHNIPSGYLDNKARKKQFNAFLVAKYGTADVVENISNEQIFLNKEKLKTLNLNAIEVQNAIVEEQMTYPHISKAYTREAIVSRDFTEGIEALIQKGFNQKRSGDVVLVSDPAYISYGKTGSTHGSGLNYDTHVPLLFFGKGINHGETTERTNITDIAPTISAMLGISFPNASIGKPLGYVLK